MLVKLYQLTPAAYSNYSIILSEQHASLKFISDTCQSLINDKCYLYNATIEVAKCSDAIDAATWHREHEHVKHWSEHPQIVEFVGACKRPISNGDILESEGEFFLVSYNTLSKVNVTI